MIIVIEPNPDIDMVNGYSNGYMDALFVYFQSLIVEHNLPSTFDFCFHYTLSKPLYINLKVFKVNFVKVSMHINNEAIFNLQGRQMQ